MKLASKSDRFRQESTRQLRVGQTLRAAISEIFTKMEYYHPLLENLFIAVSDVKITPDLRLATAFVILPNTAKQKEMIRLLQELSPKIRHLIATKVSLKYLPEIRFAVDDTTDAITNMESLFSSLTTSDQI